MSKRSHFQNNQRSRGGNRGARAAEPALPTLAERAAARKPPVTYGQPFVLMENESKQTFEFVRGAWVEHPYSIAEYRVECQVKELPQKVNRMTRYEVRRPIS